VTLQAGAIGRNSRRTASSEFRVVTAKLTAEAGTGTAATVGIAIAIGLAVGAVNGVLVAGVGMNSFIATLGASSVLTAAINAFTGGNYIGGVPESYQSLVSHTWFGVPQIAIYVIVLAVGCWIVLEHTATGRRMTGTGFGPAASRLAGVRTNRLVFASLLVSGVLASLAGALLSAKLATASPSLGQAYLLPAFAAAFLGSTQFKPGRFNVLGTIVSILLLATGVKGLTPASTSAAAPASLPSDASDASANLPKLVMPVPAT
jgi:ribose transport system permease protein